jgi:hypothetical protein
MEAVIEGEDGVVRAGSTVLPCSDLAGSTDDLCKMLTCQSLNNLNEYVLLLNAGNGFTYTCFGQARMPL